MSKYIEVKYIIFQFLVHLGIHRWFQLLLFDLEDLAVIAFASQLARCRFQLILETRSILLAKRILALEASALSHVDLVGTQELVASSQLSLNNSSSPITLAMMGSSSLEHLFVTRLFFFHKGCLRYVLICNSWVLASGSQVSPSCRDINP